MSELPTIKPLPTNEDIERLTLQRDALLAAAKDAARMLADGWIPPEPCNEEFEAGWNAACIQFTKAKTSEVLRQAIALAEKE